jgi:hypothetical protein
MENSTPSEVMNETDTSSVDTLDTSVASSEPEVNTNEPETQTNEAENTDTNPSEQLIFGKYKSIEEAEKGYKEAEKSFNRVAELEKQLKAYHDAEEKAREQREIEARNAGYSDANEQEVKYEIANHEFKRYCEAMETTLTGDAYNKAYAALSHYQQTGNKQYLDLAKSYFSPAVISQIAGDVAIYGEKALNDYRYQKALASQNESKAKLEEFAKANTDWINVKERQEALGLLIELSGGNVDFAKAKTIIDALETVAISSYEQKQKAIAENKDVQDSLLSPQSGGNPQTARKWLTREDYNRMTPEQERANYDLIVEQINLENQGKLPRALT